MISRVHRFRGRKSISEVHRRGRPAKGSLFGIKALPNPRRNEFRVAIVVSKKISKSAVVRNRIRRRLFACFRAEELAGLPPFDIVVTVFSPEVATFSQTELIAQLQRQIVKAGIPRQH